MAEVPRRQDGTRLEVEQAAGGPGLVEAVPRAVVVVLEEGERALGAALVHRRVDLRAADGDGLQVLRAHDGAEPAPAVEVLQLVDDGREADPPLAGDAGLEDANALVAELLLEAFLHLPGELPPVRPGVAELDLPVLDPEVDGRRG